MKWKSRTPISPTIDDARSKKSKTYEKFKLFTSWNVGTLKIMQKTFPAGLGKKTSEKFKLSYSRIADTS